MKLITPHPHIFERQGANYTIVSNLNAPPHACKGGHVVALAGGCSSLPAPPSPSLAPRRCPPGRLRCRLPWCPRPRHRCPFVVVPLSLSCCCHPIVVVVVLLLSSCCCCHCPVIVIPLLLLSRPHPPVVIQ